MVLEGLSVLNRYRGGGTEVPVGLLVLLALWNLFRMPPRGLIIIRYEDEFGGIAVRLNLLDDGYSGLRRLISNADCHSGGGWPWRWGSRCMFSRRDTSGVDRYGLDGCVVSFFLEGMIEN